MEEHYLFVDFEDGFKEQALEEIKNRLSEFKVESFVKSTSLPPYFEVEYDGEFRIMKYGYNRVDVKFLGELK